MRSACEKKSGMKKAQVQEIRLVVSDIGKANERHAFCGQRKLA